MIFSALLSTSIGELNGFLYIFFLPLCGAVEQLFYHRVLVLFCLMCSHKGANTHGGTRDGVDIPASGFTFQMNRIEKNGTDNDRVERCL